MSETRYAQVARDLTESIASGRFPVGSLLTAVGPAGTVYAAWTEALLGTGEYPLLLAANGRSIESDVLLDRALTTALVAPASGVVVGANEWVTAAELGLESGGITWAGTVASRGRKAELDGWLAGLVYHRGGSRELLLALPRGLSWFHAPTAPAVHVRLAACGNARKACANASCSSARASRAIRTGLSHRAGTACSSARTVSQAMSSSGFASASRARRSISLAHAASTSASGSPSRLASRSAASPAHSDTGRSIASCSSLRAHLEASAGGADHGN